MSRSIRQHPFMSNTAHESEKNDKRIAHQRERKWMHDHVRPQWAVDEDFDVTPFHLHPKSGRGLFAKGGKSLRADDAGALRR